MKCNSDPFATQRENRQKQATVPTVLTTLLFKNVVVFYRLFCSVSFNARFRFLKSFKNPLFLIKTHK